MSWVPAGQVSALRCVWPAAACEARPALHRTGVMQISAGQDGIQRLLKAEQEAQSIVTAARKGNADLKQALLQKDAAVSPHELL